MLDLDNTERALLINLLAGAIESEVFPTSERVNRLRSILAKLRADTPSVIPDLTTNPERSESDQSKDSTDQG